MVDRSNVAHVPIEDQGEIVVEPFDPPLSVGATYGFGLSASGDQLRQILPDNRFTDRNRIAAEEAIDRIA